jgi:THO complex subunit 4
LCFGGNRAMIPTTRGRGSERGRGGGAGGRGRGAGRGGRGRGRGGPPAADKSVEDLDADLDSYHAEAMQTN